MTEWVVKLTKDIQKW